MPVLKDSSFVQDQWVKLEAGEVLPATGQVLVPSQRLAADWDQLAKFPGLVGVELPNNSRSGELAPYLAHLALIVIPFPAFNDGRAYSIARQLRLDGFRGEIRAKGNILPDQLQFMRQVGIDSFEVGDRFPLESWQKASRQMSLAYQRGLFRKVGEKEVWSERHRGFDAWEEQPHAG